MGDQARTTLAPLLPGRGRLAVDGAPGDIKLHSDRYSGLSPPTVRAFVSALINLAGALLGAGIAPTVVGVVNDLLTPAYGVEALRYTLLLSPALLVFVAIFFGIVSRTVDEDTAAAEAPDDIGRATPRRGVDA